MAGRKTQVILEDKLKKLEEECKLKESERVNLELELTEVKESLKKALAGGITLGLAIEPKSGTSSPQVSSRKNYFSMRCFVLSTLMKQEVEVQNILQSQISAVKQIMKLKHPEWFLIYYWFLPTSTVLFYSEIELIHMEWYATYDDNDAPFHLRAMWTFNPDSVPEPPKLNSPSILQGLIWTNLLIQLHESPSH